MPSAPVQNLTRAESDSCGHDACCAPAASPAHGPSFRGGLAFKVRGLDCAEEVAVLKRAVGPLVGGPDLLAFDVLNGRMTVSSDARVPAEDIVRAVAGTGMTAAAWEPQKGKDEADSHHRWQVLLTAASGIAVVLGFTLHVVIAGGFGEAWRLLAGHDGHLTPLPEVFAYLAAVLFGGRYVAVKAWYALRNLRPDMNLLMTVAVIGAVVIDEWFEAATVAFLFALSLLLESWSVGRARRAIAALLDLAPPTVWVLRPGGAEVEAPVAEVKPGDHFIVKPGSRIALDGRVIAGASAVDQAPITGESVPVEKELGSDVFAGTVNGDGTLTVEATRPAEDTTLARIIRMVEEAHGRRSPSEQWVERFARVYTPAVMALALLVFVLPPILLGGAWGEWFYRALVLLVIACPCALVISTPVSIVASLAAAARAGVLVKGGAYIELPARLRAIALDKTGTLTEGRPKVVDVVPLGVRSEAEVLAWAAALEARSEHPLARAILERAAELKVTFEPGTDVRAVRGKGVVGRVNGRGAWLGSRSFLAERGEHFNASLFDNFATLTGAGRTVVAVGGDDTVFGLIAIADTVRPDAKRAMAELHAAGIERIVMLTGDNRATAEAIAREAGIDEVRAELLPEHKVDAVADLVQRHGVVAMVGDGINDAPALARANLGIAMGAIGSDAAIETADIALMTDDIGKLPWLVHHAKQTLTVIRQNIAFSLGIKALFVVLTFGGVASLWGAIAADVGASLLVVSNALRLLRAKAE